MRTIQFFERAGGNSPPRDYLESIKNASLKKKEKRVIEGTEWTVLIGLLLLLAEHGEQAILNKGIKKFTVYSWPLHSPIIEVKYRNRRLYCLLTLEVLIVLHGHDKKTSHTPSKEQKIIIDSARNYLH